MENFGAEAIWHQFENTTTKFGTNSHVAAQEQSIETVNGGCSFLRAFGWWLLFLEAVGHNGNVHPKRTKNDTWKNGFGPSNAMAQVGTLLLCQFCRSKFRLLLLSPSPGILPPLPCSFYHAYISTQRVHPTWIPGPNRWETIGARTARPLDGPRCPRASSEGCRCGIGASILMSDTMSAPRASTWAGQMEASRRRP